jgi:hypothetical protein
MNGMFGVKIQSSRWDFCFILIAPGDESPGYCHRCPLMGHQNRFKLALMPLEEEGFSELCGLDRSGRETMTIHLIPLAFLSKMRLMAKKS